MPARHYVGPTSGTPRRSTCRPAGLVRLVTERWEWVDCAICKGRLIGLVIDRAWYGSYAKITDVSSTHVTARPEAGAPLRISYRELDREWWIG